jgi:serine O-acetyltransferase
MNTLFIKLISNVTLVNKVEKDAYYILSLRKRINKSKTKLGGALLKHRYHKLCIKYGCFLPMKAQLGNDLVFPHGLFGVFVSQDASIGNSCCIFQHVTIGSNTLEDSVGKGAPIIGNNVYIGAGAKIIGNCKIGDNVRIGANTVVTKDIPDNTTVIGSNNRIIKHSVKLSNTFIPK